MNIYLIDDHSHHIRCFRFLLRYFANFDENSQAYWISERAIIESEPSCGQAEYISSLEFLTKLSALVDNCAADDFIFVDLALNQKERIEAGWFESKELSAFEAPTCGAIVNAILSKKPNIKLFIISAIDGIEVNEKWYLAIKPKLTDLDSDIRKTLKTRFIPYNKVIYPSTSLEFFSREPFGFEKRIRTVDGARSGELSLSV